MKSDKIFDVDASYQGDKVKVIEFEAAFENAPIKVEISKTDITGEKELPGAKLSVIDSDGKLVESWTSEAGKTHMIERFLSESTHSERNLHHMDIRWQVM